jgi:hypothetical protein
MPTTIGVSTTGKVPCSKGLEGKLRIGGAAELGWEDMGHKSSILSGTARMVHTCNPSHSRDRGQEDLGANSLRDPISKISNAKKG